MDDLIFLEFFEVLFIYFYALHKVWSQSEDEEFVFIFIKISLIRESICVTFKVNIILGVVLFSALICFETFANWLRAESCCG